MKRLTALVSCAFFAAACHRGSDQALQRDQKSYDVVQEGQATGTTTALGTSTSTVGTTNIGVTDTAVDTTSAFNLPGVPAGSMSTAPGTIAGSLPAGMPSSAPRTTPRSRASTTPMSSGGFRGPETTGTVGEPNRTLPQRTDTMAPREGDTTQREMQPQPTETASTTTSSTSTSTTSTSNTTSSPPPPSDTKKTDSQSQPPPPPPQPPNGRV